MYLENGIPADLKALKKGIPSSLIYSDHGASRVEFYLEDNPMKLISTHLQRQMAKGSVLLTYDELKEKYPPRERVKITTPQRGGRKNVFIEDVHEGTKVKYAKEYALFKNGKPQNDDGLALTKWNEVDKDFAEQMRVNQGIYTVEQLAKQPDAVIHTIKSGITLREKARAYLKRNADSTILSHVNKVNESLKNENKELRSELEELRSMILDIKGKPINKKK